MEGLDIFPLEYLIESKILPQTTPNGNIKLLISPESNPWAIHNVSLSLGRDIHYETKSSEHIEKELRRLMESQYGSVEEMIQQGMQDQKGENSTQRSEEDLLLSDHQSGAIQIVNSILMEALKLGATDIHFQPDQEGLHVRYRVDGILRDMHHIQGEVALSVCSRVKVLSKLDLTQKRKPQDGRTSVISSDKKVEIRVSVVPSAWGERIVLRLLDKDNLFFPSARLGLEPDQLQILKNWTGKNTGMILVTGPTGCGKSTTLYSLISEMNCRERNVMTIEDPIEYHLPSISQMQVQPKVNLNFAEGLRSILRQDPDVILVGEIRDQETARIAIRAALTGHLVLSTLHTNDAKGAITRLFDLDIEPYMIADALMGVVSQRLIRKLCLKCRKRVLMSLHPFKEAESEVFTATGCSDCYNTGYQGRTAIFELLSLEEDESKHQLIRNRKNEFSQNQHLKQMALKKLRDGVTDLEELKRVLV